MAGKNFDYIVSPDGREIQIDIQQKDTRKDVIEQYILCRKSQRLTQAEVAKRAGVPRTNITRFESGAYNPSLEMLVKLASALGMTLQIKLRNKQ